MRPGSADSHGQGSSRQPSTEVRSAESDVQESTQAREQTSVPTMTSATERVHSQSRSKSRLDTSRQQKRTLSSDSDLPSDVSVETASHPGCWFIPITVEGVKTLALIDTGASLSMMGRPLYQKIQQVSQMCLQMRETLQLEGVGGNYGPTLGHGEVDVG